MNKEDTKELILESNTMFQKQLSNFMSDVRDKLTQEPEYFRIHQEEDRENFDKVFRALEDIKSHLEKQDKNMEPILTMWGKSVTIKDFLTGSIKLVILFGSLAAAALTIGALYTYITNKGQV